MQDINTSLAKMKNDIHDLSDLITESTTNATNAHQELKIILMELKQILPVKIQHLKVKLLQNLILKSNF